MKKTNVHAATAAAFLAAALAGGPLQADDHQLLIGSTSSASSHYGYFVAVTQVINDKLDGNSYVVIRSAGESGQLYGSVSNRDIAAVLDENGFKVARAQVALNQPIKMIGLHDVRIALHPEVESTIIINVARSEDEAERQAKGEDLTGGADYEAEEEAADDIDLSEIFEDPEAAEADIVEAESTEGEEAETSEEAAADSEEEAASDDEEETKS